jgi:hydrogenase assembly chaperone HypC/HupF
MGKVDFSGIVKTVCLAHVPEVQPGQYVLVHVGFALSMIDEAEAAQVFTFLDRMNQLEPHDCPAFGTRCTPQTPLGATMVSSEGACAAYYAYGRHLEARKNYVQVGVKQPNLVPTGSPL